MNLNVRSYYSFSTRAPGILGASFKNLKLISAMSFELANSYLNVQAYHVNIFPHLPSGTQENPETYQYFLFKNENNENVLLADVWIDETTVTEQGSQTLVVTLPRISNTDVERIKVIFKTMGVDFTSKII